MQIKGKQNYKLYNNNKYKELIDNNKSLKVLGYFHHLLLNIMKFSLILIFFDLPFIKIFIMILLILVVLHWAIFKNECLLCYDLKKKMNPNYKLGSLPFLCPDLNYHSTEDYVNKDRKSWKWSYLAVFLLLLFTTKFNSIFKTSLLLIYIYLIHVAYSDYKLFNKWKNRDDFGRKIN